MIVVDNSVIMSWVLDEDTAYSNRVFQHFSTNPAETILVPSLWILEFSNVLLVVERRKRVAPQSRKDSIAFARNLPIELAPAPSVEHLSVIDDIAHRHQLSSYDAEYLRVARDAKVPLATANKALSKAASQEGVTVFG